MTRSVSLLALATTIALWCSDSDSEPGSCYAVLALGEGFSNDSVVVKVDSEVWLDGVVTTDTLDGLAWVGEAKFLYRSFHSLSVSLRPSSSSLYTSFTPKGNTTIFVRYHVDTQRFSVEYQTGLLQR